MFTKQLSFFIIILENGKVRANQGDNNSKIAFARNFISLFYCGDHFFFFIRKKVVCMSFQSQEPSSKSMENRRKNQFDNAELNKVQCI